jgi:hypothetical protein
VVNKGYVIAGSITMVTAIHLSLLDIDKFLILPNNSFARDIRQSFNCAFPLPSGERNTPKIKWQTEGEHVQSNEGSYQHYYGSIAVEALASQQQK